MMCSVAGGAQQFEFAGVGVLAGCEWGRVVQVRKVAATRPRPRLARIRPGDVECPLHFGANSAATSSARPSTPHRLRRSLVQECTPRAGSGETCVVFVSGLWGTYGVWRASDGNEVSCRSDVVVHRLGVGRRMRLGVFP